MTVILKMSFSDTTFEFHNVIAVHQSATEFTLIFDKTDPVVNGISSLCYFLILPN